MQDFIVWFEIYGKKLKTTVCAENKKEAQKIIKNKIVFHKIEKKPIFEGNPFEDDAFKKIMDIFGKPFGKK